MAAGLAFDPDEFAEFKTGRGRAAEPAPAVGGDAFDPGEFAAFKSRGNPAVTRQANPMDPGTPATFSDRFGSGPTSATLEQASTGDRKALGEGLRRVADERLVGKPSAENAFDAALFRGANALGLNLPRYGMTAVEMAKSGRSFNQSDRYVRDVEDALARQYPKTAAGGTVAGVVGGMFAMPAIGTVQRLGRLGQAAATGAGYGFAGELADSWDLAAAGKMGLVGAGAGVAGGYLIDKATPVLARFFGKQAPIRTADGALTDEAAGALREAGIDLAAITPEIEAALRAKGPSPAVAREALAAGEGITLSRGQATQDPRAYALEQAAAGGARGPRAQTIATDFGEQQASEIAASRDRLQRLVAGDGPLIDNPQSAFEAAADRARMASEQAARGRQAAQAEQDRALQALRGPVGSDVLDGATAAVQGVRDAASQAKAGYRAAYDEVAAIPGSFAPGALDRVGTRVRDRLGADVPIDEVLTPAASRAIADLDALPGLFGLRPGEGPNLQQVDQMRKRLVSYYGSTANNPTDRRAVGRILSEFDGHVEDAMGAGLFGGPGRAPNLAADDFPGNAAFSAGAPAPAAGGAFTGPETLVQFLARRGGIRLDDDARASDLGRIMTRHGPLGRRNGRAIDDFRDELVSEGFIRPDDDTGVISRRIGDEIYDLIGIERAGNPVHRLSDVSGGPVRDAGGRLADQSAAYAERVGNFQRQIADELSGLGVSPREIDPKALEDAAGRLMRREAETGADAYEAAVMARSAEPRPSAVGAADEVPFPGMGEGVGPAGSDALPIGDTGPAEAMRKARGLFRDYKQAFAPRGPGDVAGLRLRNIVDRDASPSDVVSSLFGTTTGRISSGQLQTLKRVQDAVGADSEAFGGVRNALLSRYLDGDGRGLAGRLDYLLSGEGRPLQQFLTADQMAGIRNLRVAVTQTERAGAAAPAWVANLERSGFDPNAIAASVFGAGVPGSRIGATNEARAAKVFLGETSQEWSGLRQAGIRQLIDVNLSGGKLAERIRAFTDGKGRGVAAEMFSPEELGHLRRFAAAVGSTDRPVSTLKADSKAAGVAAKAIDALLGAIAFKVGGPGAGLGAYGAKVGQRAIVGGIGTARARGSYQGGAPSTPRLLPPAALDRLAVGEGLALGQ